MTCARSSQRETRTRGLRGADHAAHHRAGDGVWPFTNTAGATLVCRLPLLVCSGLRSDHGASPIPRRGGLVGGGKPGKTTPRQSKKTRRQKRLGQSGDGFMIAGRKSSVGRLSRVRVWAGVAADGCRRPLLGHRSPRERAFGASGRAAGCPGVVPRAAVVRWTRRLHARTPRTRAVTAPFGRLRPLPHSLVNSTLPLWISCGGWFLSPNNIAGWATGQTWVRSFSFSRATHRRHPESLPTDTQQLLCELNNDRQRGRRATRWPAPR